MLIYVSSIISLAHFYAFYMPNHTHIDNHLIILNINWLMLLCEKNVYIKNIHSVARHGKSF